MRDLFTKPLEADSMGRHQKEMGLQVVAGQKSLQADARGRELRRTEAVRLSRP